MAYTYAYITCPSEEEAKRIAKHLLEKKLIGCANIFPIDSLYWWKDEIQEEKESVLIAKTSEELFGDMKEEVLKIHPYDVPCVTKIHAEPNEQYAAWLEESLGKP